MPKNLEQASTQEIGVRRKTKMHLARETIFKQAVEMKDDVFLYTKVSPLFQKSQTCKSIE
jgi:hypothetical protein